MPWSNKDFFVKAEDGAFPIAQVSIWISGVLHKEFFADFKNKSSSF